jgi:hypothetical protein
MAVSSMRKNPKGGWHRLERWVAPIECQHRLNASIGSRQRWPTAWHGRLVHAEKPKRWVAPIRKVGGTDGVIECKHGFLRGKAA